MGAAALCLASLPLLPWESEPAPSRFGERQPSPFPVSNTLIKVLEINMLTGPVSSQRGTFLSLSFFLIWPS